ncbi:MAG TPA: ATP-binding protein [Gemmatimonadaceae bacterium]|nr:ATP-binding protein [Gemmatimonadaceae bacterium]
MSDDPSRLGPLLDTAPCGFLSFADDGTVRVANATLLEMLGYRADELVGKHVESVMTVGARIFYQTHLFPLLRLQGSADEIFLLLRARNGEDVAVIINAVRRERSGEWISDCVMLWVRERRKFEDALLRAKQLAEGAQALAEQERHRVEAANEQLEQQAIEMELAQEQLMEQAEELETQSEELRALNDELTQRSEELERLRMTADEANRAKSVFLAMMSHELRTPLNAIGGYVQLLEMGIQGPVTEAQTDALSRISRSQRHLLRLINDVLNLARIEAGRVEYNVERVLLSEIAESVLPMVEPQLRSRRLRYEVRVPPALSALADREKVQQILLNLLSNASKFTPPDGCVTMEAVVNEELGGLVLVRVQDTGIGIAPDRLEHVFEPFVQVDDSHARRSEGTGLGLAISRDLARGMGGDLRAESEERKGSTFTLSLPLAHQPAAANG